MCGFSSLPKFVSSKAKLITDSNNNDKYGSSKILQKATFTGFHLNSALWLFDLFEGTCVFCCITICPKGIRAKFMDIRKKNK